MPVMKRARVSGRLVAADAADAADGHMPDDRIAHPHKPGVSDVF